MEWTLVIEGEREGFATREALLERLGELLEDHLAQSPLADAEVFDPFGNEHEVVVGIRLEAAEE
jgi:hypothetical protein